MIRTCLLLVAVVATGCAHVPSRQTASVGDLDSVCQKQHVDQVTVCDQMYPDRPYLRLPAPSVTNSAIHFYAAASPRFLYGYQGGVSLVATDESSYQVVGADGKPISGLEGLPKNLKMPNNRYLFTIYLVDGTLSEDKQKITISKMSEAVHIQGCAIDSQFLGDWSGQISARTATGFDRADNVSFDLKLSDLSAARSISSWKGDKTEKDGDVYTLNGTIANASKLRSNPFDGASTGALQIFRITTMHIPGDNHIGINYPPGTKGLSPTGMSELRLMSPENFIRTHELDSTVDWAQAEFRPHAPGFGPGVGILTLRPVRIGRDSRSVCH